MSTEPHATPPRRPLDGMVVLDFSQIVAGPLAALVLADLGALVVKIEPPTGDAARQLGSRPRDNYAGMFESFNRGKQSIVLDLRTEEGRDEALRLVEVADVLIESSRVGVMQRLGLGAERLRALNPRLVYVSISAYGPDGEDATRGGVDIAIQAETGWMSITGEPDGPPTKLGSVPIDAATGHVAAQAALAALLGRERHGQGETIHVSLYDVGCHLHTHDFTDYLSRGWVAQRAGNFPAVTTPAGVYETADGTMVLAAYMPHHWSVALDILDDDRLRDDPRFATMKDRIVNRDVLLPLLQSILRTRTSDEWMRRFAEARLTCGVVLDTGEVARSRQFADSGLALTAAGPDGRTVGTIRTPARYAGFRPPPAVAAPQLDGDRDEIIAGLLDRVPTPQQAS